MDSCGSAIVEAGAGSRDPSSVCIPAFEQVALHGRTRPSNDSNARSSESRQLSGVAGEKVAINVPGAMQHPHHVNPIR